MAGALTLASTTRSSFGETLQASLSTCRSRDSTISCVSTRTMLHLHQNQLATSASLTSSVISRFLVVSSNSMVLVIASTLERTRVSPVLAAARVAKQSRMPSSSKCKARKIGRHQASSPTRNPTTATIVTPERPLPLKTLASIQLQSRARARLRQSDRVCNRPRSRSHKHRQQTRQLQCRPRRLRQRSESRASRSRLELQAPVPIVSSYSELRPKHCLPGLTTRFSTEKKSSSRGACATDDESRMSISMNSTISFHCDEQMTHFGRGSPHGTAVLLVEHS